MPNYKDIVLEYEREIFRRTPEGKSLNKIRENWPWKKEDERPTDGVILAKWRCFGISYRVVTGDGRCSIQFGRPDLGEDRWEIVTYL